MLKGRAVTIAHQVVDEAFIALGGLLTRGRSLQGLFSLGGDSGGKNHIGIGCGVADKLHGHIRAEDDVGGSHGDSLRIAAGVFLRHTPSR